MADCAIRVGEGVSLACVESLRAHGQLIHQKGAVDKSDGYRLVLRLTGLASRPNGQRGSVLMPHAGTGSGLERGAVDNRIVQHCDYLG